MTSFEFAMLFICTMFFGGTIGAYFTTAEYRIRHNKPLATAYCYCPTCNHKLSITHQIPILSWICLKGKCYYCKATIPTRYPIIEGGFLAYYGSTFLLLYRIPLLMICIWFGLIALLLCIRCQGNYRSMIKGLLIFLGYHLLYGSVLLIIFAALKPT